MGYIGRGPVKSGAFRIIDDVSSSFNGSTTAFTVQSSSSNITPGTEQNLLIAVDGVLQEPVDAFTISGSTLTFTSAPASGASFWGVELGDVGGIAQTVANDAVNIAGLSATGTASSSTFLRGDNSWTALATIAQTDTGTVTTTAVTPDSLAGSVAFGTRYVQCVVVDSGTDIAEGPGKFFFHIPAGLNGMNLVEAHARVATAGSGSTVDIDFFLNTSTTDAAIGNDMLDDHLTIDDGELDSSNAATAVTFEAAYDDVDTNDMIRIDVDGNGGDSTVAKGLIVTMGFRLP